MIIDEFEKAVRKIALASAICLIPQVRRSSATAFNLRVPPTTGEFIDIFYNKLSGTVAYALIKEQKRIYGADNTEGWHFHPFERPSVHIPLPGPLPFSDFLSAAEEFIQG